MRLNPLLPLMSALALGGCSIGSIAGGATTPLKTASKAVDLATTSQSEADEKRGRKLRKLEEKYAKLERNYRKEGKRCAKGNAKACEKRDAILEKMEAIRVQLPPQPL